MLAILRRWLTIGGFVAPMLLLSCQSDDEVLSPTKTADSPTVSAVPNPNETATAISPTNAVATVTLSPVPVRPGYAKYRWGNVTLVVPEGVVSIGRSTASREALPPNGGLVIDLHHGSSAATIEAENGGVISQTDILDKEIEDVISTVRVGERMDDPLPWPLGDSAPSTAKEVAPFLRYWLPEPASGITLFTLCGVSTQQQGSGCATGITNGQSWWSIDPTTGDQNHDDVAAEDTAAFNRWIESLERVAP